MRLILLALSLLLALPASAATPELLASLDALHARRSEEAAIKEQEETLKKELQAAPEDYELLWRQARLLVWQADGASDARQKKVLGKQAWDVCERGVKLAPQRVECQYFAAGGIGTYSQAVGIMKALKDGLEGKFNERLDAAIKIDPTFDMGAPWLAKGRYHYELPWPKRDLGESAKLYEKALAKFPNNLRANYYLAETLLADDEAKKAREAILKVKQGNVAYDPPEGRRVQEWAKKVEADIEEELK
ncbi:tetratricopeptide repeat protein [Hyalangium rubrum]|uniref:Tetratricopeptide repeat protein n=1 Tax=Hyalangium rubrum TaxID=3103134 RepID=A0ABU5GUR7_9BACT|nr:tetratricopeptide repeat protein [Hyalangium sp. s54d21]MDY7224831.1 tetratricopeptide repeat protein [Hyalangium sp. s54d21]